MATSIASHMVRNNIAPKMLQVRGIDGGGVCMAMHGIAIPA